MIISQLAPEDKERFSSTHVLHFQGADDSHLIQMSGIVTLDFHAKKLTSSSRGWVNEQLTLILTLPEAASQSGFYVEQCSPLITLNAIGGVSTVDWAVNSFRGETSILCQRSYSLEATIGVYSTGEILHNIGYSISLSGHFNQ
jgi:hypothetical protein